MKNKMIMLVGLQASGKSYQAKVLAKKYNAKIFSSDEYREKLLGSELDQSSNSKIFDQLNTDIINELTSGNSIIFDACNLNSRKRRAFLQKIKKIDCEKICVVIARKLENCIKANEERERTAPRDSIINYYKSFQMPYLEEGWDKIEVIYTDKDGESIHVTSYDFKFINYEQDSKYHSQTLGTHLWMAAAHVRDKYKDDKYFDELYEAAKLHDIGKPFCRTIKNKKGIEDGNAHYYGHECVGAYDSLFIKYDKDVDKQLIAFLINNHMRPLNWNNGLKAMNRDRENFGKEKFELILKLNEADVESH